VTLVGDSDTQQPGLHHALDLFTDPLFLAAREWAKQFGDPWFITSTRHGLLRPHTPVEPYVRHPPRDMDATRWARRVTGRLVDWYPNLTHVTLLCDDPHLVTRLRWWLCVEGVYPDHPLRGLTGDQRLAWFRTHRTATSGYTASPGQRPGRKGPARGGHPTQQH
jgi:hypothetical protein